MCQDSITMTQKRGPWLRSAMSRQQHTFLSHYSEELVYPACIQHHYCATNDILLLHESHHFFNELSSPCIPDPSWPRRYDPDRRIPWMTLTLTFTVNNSSLFSFSPRQMPRCPCESLELAIKYLVGCSESYRTWLAIRRESSQYAHRLSCCLLCTLLRIWS